MVDHGPFRVGNGMTSASYHMQLHDAELGVVVCKLGLFSS